MTESYTSERIDSCLMADRPEDLPENTCDNLYIMQDSAVYDSGRWEIDPVDFDAACRLIAENGRQLDGIGTLAEKSVHAALKIACEPGAVREAQIGGFIADAVGEHGIIEIQTRGFGKMKDKLTAFLEVAPVTVVWPCCEILWLRSIDPDTGESISRRKSPKRQRPVDVFAELYPIRGLIAHPNFHLKVVSLEAEQIRLKLGKDSAVQLKRRKRRWPAKFEKLDKIPVRMLGQISVDDIDGWRRFSGIPAEMMPENFTAKQLAELLGISDSTARMMLACLGELEITQKVGKQGNAYIYKMLNKP